MKVSNINYTDIVKQVSASAVKDFGNKAMTTESFLYTLSYFPQFEMCFDGDIEIFRKNLKTVLNTYKPNEDIVPEDGIIFVDEVLFDSGFNTATAIAGMRYAFERISKGEDEAKVYKEIFSIERLEDHDMVICLADILLAMQYTQLDDFSEYVITSGESISDFIENMYAAEGFKYGMDDFRPDILDSILGTEGDDFGRPVIVHMGFGNPLEGISNPFGEKVDWKDYCNDLLEEEKEEKRLLVGREKELAETIRILCRKEKANPIHIGDAGVGKTEITLGLARKINNNDVPERIKGAKLYSLDIGSLMAGTEYRGQMEQRLKVVIDELKKQSEEGMVILYIDEIHMICGAGGSNSSMNVANIIKPMLTKSNIRVIGATTHDEYKQHIEKDKALARRFKQVTVVEPSPDEAKEIIRGIIPLYEDYHHVKYDDGVGDIIVDLSVKYVHDKKLPDKAIDIIDEAGASLSQDWDGQNDCGTVTKKMVENIIANSYGIPVQTVEKDDIAKLRDLDKQVTANVFGQDDAVAECIKAIKLSRLGLTEENKPIASLLFVGQTGVGKTEVAKQIANALDINLIRFDMSEYMDDTAVNKLIGASAGYVGYDDGGLLVEEIRQHPYSVLLLDEVEKANPKVFNAFLQVMDNATLTDNKGRKADFKNVIIIMTSNAGANDIIKTSLGFGGDTKVVDFSSMDKAVERTFTPEFRNRLTKVVKFNSMNDDMAERIVVKHLNNLINTVEKKGIKVTYDTDVVKYVKDKGITVEYGARELLRVINDDIKMLFVDVLMSDNVPEEVKLEVNEDKLVLK